MSDSKKIIESFKEGVKNAKKQHLKSCKNRSNSKANIYDKENKISGLMLSRIEEFIEIGQANKGINLKDRLLDTCVLKDLKKLFINPDNKNNKDNGMFGYTIDNKNKTIIKFNKSPNQLQIEQFVFPEKKQQNKRNIEVNKFKNNDTNDKIDLNNISENKENINFIKKFKDNYSSDPEDFKKKKKKVKSNIVMHSKKWKNEIKKNRYKNTVLVKHLDFNTILKMNSKDKRKLEKNIIINPKQIQKSKREENKKEKDINQKEKEKNKKEDNKKNKEKDDVSEKDNNNNKVTTIRRKKKSKTKKQQKISFHLNKDKLSNKINENLKSNNNIENINIQKKTSDTEDCKIEDNIMKSSNKFRIKSNKNNVRESLKSCYFENNIKNQKSPKSKKSMKRKMIKFQSLLTKKKSLFESKKSKLYLKQKRDSNFLSQKEDSEDSFYKENSVKDRYSTHSQKSLNKGKYKKQKNLNNIKIYKNINDKNESDIPSKNNSIENIKLKENDSKNKIKSLSHFKIKHVNDIFLGNTQNNKQEYNNALMKVPVFSVVKPEKLIYFEYNKSYERPEKQNNILAKNSQNLINEKKMKKANDNNDNESFDNNINKRKKGIFCCL